MYVLATYLALVLLATPLHATVPIFLLYAALSAAAVWTAGTRPPEKDADGADMAPLALPIVIFAAMRLIPFLRWGASALGADMGAYYRNFNACFASLAACAGEPAALAGYPFYALGMGTQAVLIAMHCVAAAALFVGAYRIAESEWGRKPAFWSALALAISLPQFLFYWSFFLKMEISAALSLFALHAYGRKQKRTAAYAALAGMVHPLPLVPLAAALVAAGIADKEKRYAFAVAATGIAATAAFKWKELAGYAGYAASYAKGTYAPAAEPLLTGHFVGFAFYHDALMLFYVPFALLSIAWCVKKGKMPAIGWYALVNLVLISVNAAFHNRFIALFDMGCVIFSGYALAAFARKQKTLLGASALAAIVIFLAAYSLRESARMEPLVNAAEFEELTALQGKYAGMPVFVNSAVYRQFVAGYTEHAVILAPFGEEPWKSFGAPSLVYNARRSTPVNPADDPHFSRISERIFLFKL